MIKIKLGVKNYDPKLKELVDEKVYKKYKIYGEMSESEAKKVAYPLKDLIETLDKIQEKQTKEYEEEKSKRKGKDENREKEVKKEGERTDEKILKVIEENPYGIKLTKIGEELGVDWKRLVKRATMLVNNEKIRKDEKTNLYHPEDGGDADD